jgi:ABC-type transport system involved in multi-copper enzyme maturation permease subunit
MNTDSEWGYRWHATLLIQRREWRSMIFSWGLYIALSLALLAAILILRNHLNFVGENGLLVVSGAFTLPLFAVTIVSSLFLALSSVTTIAREREQGTMEALFYGPIDAFSYVLGKYLAQIATYLVMVIFYGCCFLFYASLTNFAFSGAQYLVLLLSVLIASNFIVVGIFFSALSGKVRTALLLFLGLVLVFLAIELGRELVIATPLQGSYYNPVQFLQNVLSFLSQITAWLSPFSYLSLGMDAVRRGSTNAYLTILLISTAYTILFLGLSVVTLERKGVRK